MSNGGYLMPENESSIYIEGSKYYVSLAYTYTISNQKPMIVVVVSLKL